MKKLDRKARLFCLFGPSGSGKSIIAKNLCKYMSDLHLSVSTTSRPPREGEKEGIHYFFVTRNEFSKRIERGQFIEYAEYNGNYYGTQSDFICKSLQEGKDVLLDIEIKGVGQLKNIFGKQLVNVLILPPSLLILKDRLCKRGTESKEEIHKRMEVSMQELQILDDNNFSDYLVINDSLDETIELVSHIIKAERVRMKFLSLEILKKNFLSKMNHFIDDSLSFLGDFKN